MAKKPPEKKPSTWRDLNAASSKKRRKIPLSLRAKLRVAWLWIRAVALIAIVGALGYGAYYLYENTFFEEIFSAKSGEVKRVEFKTDGLITAKWLADFVNIPKNAKLNEVDIFAIKNALTALPQVESAAVERAYPDAIKITLVEYKPFMKLFTQVSGKQRIFIMTLGGKFFEPVCIPPEMIDAMPKLEGWKPVFSGSSPADYKAAGKVAEFLEAAYKYAPQEARSWKRIDVSELESRTLPLICVRTDSDMEIVFAPRDYKKQFERLEYILRYRKENPLTIIKRIDLSIKGWAPVKIKTSK